MLSKINSCCVTKSNLASSQKSKRPNFTGMIEADDLLVDAKKIYIEKYEGGFWPNKCIAIRSLATDRILIKLFEDKMDHVKPIIKKLKKAIAWAQSYEGPDILDISDAKYGIYKRITNDFKPEIKPDISDI